MLICVYVLCSCVYAQEPQSMYLCVCRFFYLFIIVLQYKSVGHLVLQPSLQLLKYTAVY